MKISVIIPAYKAAAMIGETLASVLNQQPPPCEVIVVDDGSPDTTGDVVRSFGPAVRYFRQENQGESVARNFGLKVATGDGIVFLDSDDLLAEGALQAIGDVLDQNDGLDGAYGQVVFFGEGREPSDPQGGMLGFKGNILPAIIRGATLLPGQFALRRRCLERCGGFKESIRFGEDWEFLLRVTRESRLGYVPVVFLRKREHPGMQSRSARRQDIVTERMGILREVLGKDYDALAGPVLTRRVLADWVRSSAFMIAAAGRRSEARREMVRSLRYWPFQPALYVWLVWSVVKRRRVG
jgi:glycosyltransferase involved in cell wall biosynthesis